MAAVPNRQSLKTHMCVPHGLVGIIIGCGGANIKKLQSKLKVNMTVESKKNGEGVPNLHIEGSPINVQRAKDTILTTYRCNMQNQCTRQGCKFFHPGRDSIHPNRTAEQSSIVERATKDKALEPMLGGQDSASPMSPPMVTETSWAENDICQSVDDLARSCQRVLNQVSHIMQLLSARHRTQPQNRTRQTHVGQSGRNS